MSVKDPIELAERRARHLQRIIDGYEVYDEGMPDSSAPFASAVETSHEGKLIRKHPRYVLVWQYGDKGNYRVNLADSLAQLQDLAANEVHEGALISCYFDLDQLTGEEPILTEGDRVLYEGAERVVSHHDYESSDGEPYAVVYLESEGDDPWEGPLDPDNTDIELIERAYPDERMPVRYGVAGVKTVIAFNTIPSP